MASATGSFAASVSLTPGESLSIGIPLRQNGTCYEPDASTGGNTFYVKERFGLFTHWVAVQVQVPWTLRAPMDPDNGGPYSASDPPRAPAQDLVCPATK